MALRRFFFNSLQLSEQRMNAQGRVLAVHAGLFLFGNGHGPIRVGYLDGLKYRFFSPPAALI